MSAVDLLILPAPAVETREAFRWYFEHSVLIAAVVCRKAFATTDGVCTSAAL
ncbi:MAG: hypothetical protein ACSLFJ_08240 [Immundisolibacter sp.]|uniref:hypothetical protein n=1 Tax=Immundisolibacter sp. TaxID=1934948 RepID=UPI003EE058D6